MNYRNYGDRRRRICYGNYSGIEKNAVDNIYALIQSYVPYILTAVQAQESNADDTDISSVFIGTLDSNPAVAKLAAYGFFEPETHAEGYSIKAAPNPANPERSITVLQGADEAGVLYAAADYARLAVRDRETYHGYHYDKKYRPFIDDALPFERRSFPKIEHRGFWSWGHAIYDYKKYIDHMAECKLNTLILWNDFVPINAADVIAYAHSHAVKVVWGYSWCWGEQVDPLNPAELEKWTKFVLDTYEKQYLPLGCDGIYFQTFTETSDTEIGGKSIAELVIDWVDNISRKVYERYPDLWIQFGLHATSIRGECGKFSAIDPRMSIVWENAGCFPYSYDPSQNDCFEETLEYTRELLALRGEWERFGAVLKGFTVLNWSQFEHQQGAFILGAVSPDANVRRSEEKDFYWRYAAPYWINQAPELQQILQAIADANVHDRLVTALVEDGMWESSMHTSAQLFAQLLWDPYESIPDILTPILHDKRTVI